eukprot:COSAG03_NODE_2526_length_2670_cov_9.520420_4_plen_59_part_00
MPVVRQSLPFLSIQCYFQKQAAQLFLFSEAPTLSNFKAAWAGTLAVQASTRDTRYERS